MKDFFFEKNKTNFSCPFPTAMIRLLSESQAISLISPAMTLISNLRGCSF